MVRVGEEKTSYVTKDVESPSVKFTSGSDSKYLVTTLIDYLSVLFHTCHRRQTKGFFLDPNIPSYIFNH